MSTHLEESKFVQVLSIRRMTKHGVLFSGYELDSELNRIDAKTYLVISALKSQLGAEVRKGQVWSVRGVVSKFVNSSTGYAQIEEQLKLSEAELIIPTGEHFVEFIASCDDFPNIGRVKARRLWSEYGNELFQILDFNDYQAIAKVLSPESADILLSGWHRLKLSKTLQFLQTHDVPLSIGRRLLDYFGAELEQKLEENPYRIISFTASFKAADQLARTVYDIPRDDPRRLCAAVEEALYRQFDLGHTLVPEGLLKESLSALLGKDSSVSAKSAIETAVAHANSNANILFDRNRNAFTLGSHVLESIVASALLERINSTYSLKGTVQGYVDKFEAGEGFRLNVEQTSAVDIALRHNLAVITGGAGCGKTTVLKCIHSALESEGYSISLMALSGKAAKRMSEATSKPAKTIHSFISQTTKAAIECGIQQESRLEGRQAVVIDEASMVDVITMARLVACIPPACKLILIGDPHQLPPVGPGLVFHCLAGMPSVPQTELKVAKRFGGEIEAAAQSIKDGVFPELSADTDSAVSFLEVNANDIADAATQLFLANPENSRVLSATRAVAERVNQACQMALTQKGKRLTLFNIEYQQVEATPFFLNDEVICTQNQWEIGLQNGSMGRIVEIFDVPAQLDSDAESDELALGWILWDDGQKRPVRESLLESLELAYCITIHKSQGSQWPTVICALATPKAQRVGSLVDRSMIYTAITRAQNQVTLIGQKSSLKEIVSNPKKSDLRLVGLRKKLVEA
ncbi:MAG: AAA family ATPase [Limnobacter sp.]|nr:AAA family ATPase [Limnobacter sp.]